MVLWSVVGQSRTSVDRVLWWIRAAGAPVVASLSMAAVPPPLVSPHGLAASGAFLVTCAAWLVALTRERSGRDPTWAMGAFGLAGAVFAVVDPHGLSLVIPYVGVGYAGAALPLARAVAVSAGTGATLAVGFLVVDPTVTLVWAVPFLPLALASGWVRRTFVLRAEQAELLLAQAERARKAETRSAALAERARLAREIHDVLAHSLSALTVQLGAADALLASGQADRAHEMVLRAGRFAREGLVETRRAVVALRGDQTALPEALESLAGGHRAWGAGAPVTVTVDGPPRELPPDVDLALYRAAQEAFTNAGKHAPGAPVRVLLRYTATDVTLTVANGAAAEPTGPLAGSGAGAGLVGMRERVHPLGGEVTAGPAGAGWRVRVRIPG